MPSRRPKLVLLFGLTLVGWQTYAQPTANRLEFEVASVKPAAGGVRKPNVVLGAGESLTITNVPLRMIILYAYDLRDFQLSGGPGWIGDERYDIVARAVVADRIAPDQTTETDDQRTSRVARARERLRSLLSVRFAFREHVEQRMRTTLELQLAKSGTKLSQAVSQTDKAGTVSTVPGHIQGYEAPISMLAAQLSVVTGLIVRDETGLHGKYDFALDWAADEKDQGDTPPSIFTAVTEQLGLRLERAREPVATLVIDNVERPSAN